MATMTNRDTYDFGLHGQVAPHNGSLSLFVECETKTFYLHGAV